VAAFAAAVAGLAAAGPVAAQEAPKDPALEALVQEALRNNPDLETAKELALAARERPAQASSLADPVLSVNYTNDGWSPSLGAMPDTNLAIMASQDLPFPGKRRLRAEIAAREADVVDQQVARARLSVAASVRRSYYGLLLSRALLALTHQQGALWQHMEGVARARYGVGQGDQQDVLRTQVEVTRVGQFVAEQEAQIAVRVAEINRLLGRPADTPLPTDAGLAPVPAGDLSVELETLRQVSPELAAARVAVERARLAVQLARKDYKPDFVVQGGYMNRGGLDPMWQVGVGVNLPIRRHRRASALAEAEAQARAAEARVASIELQLRLRAQERLAQLEAARQTAVLYAGGIVPQDEMSVEAARASYQTGRVPFVTVLEALSTLYTDRSTLLRLLESQARIRTSLDEASLESGAESVSMSSAPSASPGSAATGGAGSVSMDSMGR
jgi:outer membrane protein TolC